MAIRKNTKRIDPRYFLHETTNRDELEEGNEVPPKRKPEHVDYDKGHADGFEGNKRRPSASKEYNEGYDDGIKTDAEYKKKTDGDKK